MATPALSSIVQQQAEPEAVPITSTTSTSAWQSSGSVAPFFAVMCVLIVLAVLSCYLGRLWNPRPKSPLESIRGRGFSGWLKRGFRERFAKDVEVGAKVMVCDHEDIDHCNVKDAEVVQV